MVKPSAAPHMAAATETRSCVRTGANRKGGESQEMGTHNLHNIAALAVHHLVWLCTTNVNTARSPIERTRSPLRRSKLRRNPASTRHRCLHCRKQLGSTRQVMRQVWPAYLSIGGSSISGTVRTTRSHHHRVLCIVA